jgi:hypothetical protein
MFGDFNIILLLVGIYKAEIRGDSEEVIYRVRSLFKLLNMKNMLVIDQDNYDVLYENISRALIECAFKRHQNVHMYVTNCIRYYQDMYIPESSGMAII